MLFSKVSKKTWGIQHLTFAPYGFGKEMKYTQNAVLLFHILREIKGHFKSNHLMTMSQINYTFCSSSASVTCMLEKMLLILGLYN